MIYLPESPEIFCLDNLKSNMETIELEYVKIHYAQPIVYLAFKEDAAIGFPEVRELTFYAEKLSGHKPYVVFSDCRVNMDVTREGRRLAAKAKEAPLHKGSAVLVKNTAYQLAANLFSEFDKPEFPYRVFTDKQKALDWLLQLPLSCQLTFNEVNI